MGMTNTGLNPELVLLSRPSYSKICILGLEQNGLKSQSGLNSEWS